jgi:hypothetical protein
MTSLYATTSRLIDEYLEALLTASQLLDGGTNDSNSQFVRLAGAGLALAQQHTVDSKGRCRICTRRRHLRRRRMRPCSVYSALSFYLTQPDELVQQVLPELIPARPAPEPVEADQCGNTSVIQTSRQRSCPSASSKT